MTEDLNASENWELESGCKNTNPTEAGNGMADVAGSPEQLGAAKINPSRVPPECLPIVQSHARPIVHPAPQCEQISGWRAIAFRWQGGRLS